MQLMFTCVVALLWLALVPPAQAQTGTTTQPLQLRGMLASAGMLAPFTGDTNANNSVVFEWRVCCTGTWRLVGSLITGIDRRSVVNNNGGTVANPNQNTGYAPLIGMLDRNTTYEVRATWTDPNGVTGTNPQVGTFTTYSHDQPPQSGGTTYYVDCSAGGGGNGSQGSPWNSLTTANANVTPGDTVRIVDQPCPGATLNTTGLSGNYIRWTADVQTQGSEPRINSLLTVAANYLIIEYLDLNEVDLNECLNCLIQHNIWQQGRGLDLNATSPGANDGVIIQNNRFCDQDNNGQNGCPDGVGFDGECSTNGCYGIYMFGASFASGVVVRNNDPLSGSRDALGGAGNASYNAGYAYTEIYQNNIMTAAGSLADDCVEVEGNSEFALVYDNTMRNCAKPAMAWAPINQGPIYVVYNTMAFTSGSHVCFKTGNTQPDGYGYAIHNTCYGTTDIVRVSAAGKQDNLRIYSNAGGGLTQRVIDQQAGQGTGWVINWVAADTDGEIDYRLAGVQYANLAAFQAGTGQNPNGIEAANLFESPITDLTPRDGSPLIDAAPVIESLNDSNGRWPFMGAGPDVGGIESGVVVLVNTILRNGALLRNGGALRP